MKYRIEKDELGEKKVPMEAYYGIYTLRSKENFEVTKRGLCRQMIKALAVVKKSAANANADVSRIDKKIAEAISLSCDEILNGRLHGQFITDIIQGGAGLSMNMNANEVIANRANEMLGGEKGKYDLVDPIKHLNLSQMTNEVIPTAGKITAIRLVKKMTTEGKKLLASFAQKAAQLDALYTKNANSQYKKLKEEFERFEYSLVKCFKQIEQSCQELLEISIGFATNNNTEEDDNYVKRFLKYLSQATGDKYYLSKNLVDTTRNIEPFATLSSTVKRTAINLSNTANDLRIMSTDNYYNGLIQIPEVQAATNSTYEKKYPVILEMINQVAFYVIGADATIACAAETNHLDYNMNLPVILATLFEILNLVRRSIIILKEKAIDGITFN